MQHLDRVPDSLRLDLLRLMVPELFSNSGTLLYVGAHIGGFAASKPLYEVGNQITVLDIWPNAIEILKVSPLAVRVDRFILGDVRHLEEIELPPFDYSVWMHGPEHIEFGELPGALAGLEAITRRTVVVACPWGKAPHGWKENPHNKHVSFLGPNDFYRLGYQVVALSPINKLGGHILAWRGTDEEASHTD